MVRSPVCGPRVAINAVHTAPRAVKQSIVATACLRIVNVEPNKWTCHTYGKVNVKNVCARVPIGIVVNTQFTDLVPR